MNKNITKTMIIIILTLGILSIGTTAKAAVESKPKGTAYTNISVSDSYALCYNMRNNDSSLGNNSLDPHLTTNADWGAAAYLGLSQYGGVRGRIGNGMNVDDSYCYSTTTNITGIMNMGSNRGGESYTYTSSIKADYEKCGFYNSKSGSVTNLHNNINTKYVETLPKAYIDANNKGKAFEETCGWYSSAAVCGGDDTYIVTRKGVVGFYEYRNSGGMPWGEALSNVTFRPVIWN